ncbi:MAG: hypothetical protein GY793_04820 [Proteobacteria bacterium]|nr:hypothetical protein [Pseudomonadota bacterium]
MTKKIVIIFSLVLLTSTAYSNDEYTSIHKQKQQKLFGTLDYCSNIGSQNIFSIGSKDLSTIKADFTNIKESLQKAKKEKESCFDQSKSMLDDIISDNLIELQLEESTRLQLQNQIDLNLADTITLRKQINSNLIDSILSDIEKSLKTNETAMQNPKLAGFVKESRKTQILVKEELNIIYDSMQRQLNLDKSFLEFSDKPTVAQIAEISVMSAFININRALLLFENLEKGSKGYNLSKIKTYLQLAHNKLLELKGFSNKLEGLDSKTDINKIINQLSILNVDLEVTIKDLLEDSFSENFLGWAGRIYQQCGDISTRLQKILDTIYLINATQDTATNINQQETGLTIEPKKTSSPQLDQQAPEE